MLHPIEFEIVLYLRFEKWWNIKFQVKWTTLSNKLQFL
jgi:hypothetical protein